MVKFLGKEDLWRLNAKMREQFISGNLKEPAFRYGFNLTSGTSSGKPLMVASHYPNEMFQRFSHFKRPIILLGSMTGRLSQAVFFFYGRTSLNASALLLDSSDLKLGVELERLIDNFKPDSIFGFPTSIVRLLENINSSETRKYIETIGFIGEGLSNQKEQIFRDAVPGVKIVGVYGNAELGALSRELCVGSSIPTCPYLETNQYHPNDEGGVKIEIIEQDKDGIGEVVVSLRGFLYPVMIERYRTGDVGRFVSQQCRCGDSVTFELLGRKGLDYIKLAGTLLLQQEFDRVIAEFAEYIEDYRVTAREIMRGNKMLGEVNMQIIPKEKLLKKSEPTKWIAKHISRELFVTPTRTFMEATDAEVLVPLTVTFADEFPYQHKGIKLRQIT